MPALSVPSVGEHVSWTEGEYEYRGRVRATEPGPGAVMLIIDSVRSRRRNGRNWFRENDRRKNVVHVEVMGGANG